MMFSAKFKLLTTYSQMKQYNLYSTLYYYICAIIYTIITTYVHHFVANKYKRVECNWYLLKYCNCNTLLLYMIHEDTINILLTTTLDTINQ